MYNIPTDNLIRIMRFETDAVNYAVLLIYALIMAKWLKAFVENSRAAYAAGAVYAVPNLILINLPGEKGDSLIKFLPAILAVLTAYLLDNRRNLKQKLFLVLTFITTRWLVAGTLAEISFFERDFVFSHDFFKSSVPITFWEFIIWELILGGCNIFLLERALFLIQRTYTKKSEDMEMSELILLAAPLCAILSVRPLVSEYYDLWGQGILAGYITENIPGDVWKLIFYALSFVAVVAIDILYQNIKASRENEKNLELLKGQTEEIRRHIGRIEEMYADMRGLKHDMGNHIAVIEELTKSGNIKEAYSYIESLKESLNAAQPRIKTGNPVTDIIISEYAEKLSDAGISLKAAFTFPNGEIDAFDISIILNNALQNAYEELLKHDKRGEVALSSYQREGIYIIEVSNIADSLHKLDKETGLPASDKAEAGHGYGLKNIRNVALKYNGDIDITQDELGSGEILFKLIIMLQTK
ncbi:MAG: GHKL domain-containing protein [Lachnospiraceae bacterium]|nr:GHKL domain-containing protein [Lachnospiraceae bacterium]